MKSYLELATGDIFTGTVCGGDDETSGEVVLYHSQNFHYQILTDPVNYNRIIVSDSDFIDNRAPLFAEIESYSPHLKALVILGELRQSPLAEIYSSLENYLTENDIALFIPDESDRLKQILGSIGTVKGEITSNTERQSAISLDNLSSPPENDPVRKLSTSLEFFWDLTDETYFDDGHKEYVIVAYDFGLTYSTLRNLKRLGCDIRVVPADYSPEQVIALKPEGILLAGGPGRPGQMEYAISNISRLIGLRPILATGLGHVLLALSVGAEIEILKSPHFGNEFVVDNIGKTGMNRRYRKIRTSQSHSISINRESLEKEGFKVTLTNRQDHSVEAFISEENLIHSYAFSLGGRDQFTTTCLKSFVACMTAHRAGAKSK
ncbi:MAG: hypothetical protein GY839_20980 [candidate division Zixibacteria bacterium]|nr:hypothetical protein [candidate division Zixibacteria bacterium]